MGKRILLILIVIGLPFTAVWQPVTAQDVASDLLGRINALRANQGLAPYSLNGALTSAAQNHATWMATTAQVSHVQENGSTPQDRARAAGYTSSWVSENIYMGGRATVDDAWRFWLNSPIHYAGLTNANYQHIGIASARGNGGQSFVLVFGVPGGTTRQLSPSRNAGGNQAAAPAGPPPQPPGVIGRDPVGNIRYQIQAGDTLGQILLMFGYTWDDLPELMALNDLSDADIRSLDVGQEVLVMPADGTYTPTPMPEVTDDPAPETTPETAPEITEEALVPSVTETAPPVTQTVSSPTPAITPTQTATPRPVTQVALAVTPISNQQIASPLPPAQTAGDPTNTLLLMVVIGIQVGILIFAALEFWRRMRSN